MSLYFSYILRVVGCLFFFDFWASRCYFCWGCRSTVGVGRVFLAAGGVGLSCRLLELFHVDVLRCLPLVKLHGLL